VGIRKYSHLYNGKTAPDDKLWRAAQLAVGHNLCPFSGEVQLYKVGSFWIVDIGIAGWRQLADRKSRYSFIHEEVPEDELKLLIGEHYHPNDRGCKGKLWRLDEVRECKELEVPYEPKKSMGFYRIHAFYDKSKQRWIADTIPNQRRSEDVARRRAEKMALKDAYPVSRITCTAEEIEQQVLSWSVDHHRTTALPIEEELDYTEDGDIIFAPE